MAPLICSVLLFAILVVVPSGLAGPACARRLQGQDSCTSQCDKRWGWSGRAMGTDPWGSVMTVTVTDMNIGSIVTKQCRVRPTSTSDSSATPSATAPIANVAPQVSVTNLPVSSVPSASVVPSSSHSITSSGFSTVRPSTRVPNSLVATRSASSSRFSSSVSSSTPTPSSTPENSSSSTPSSQIRSTTAPPPPPSSSPSPSLSPTPKPSSSPSKAATTQAVPSPVASLVTSSSSTSSSDIDQYLSAHNTVRAQHGASPLTWSDELAGKAQQWANGCVFQHSGGSLGAFGENLAAGTGDAYNVASAVKSWTDEVSEYDPNNPQPSHFTQVVWKGSTQLGCAVQLCDGIFDPSFGKAKFFVCEYSPQGNIIGEFAQNVQV